MAELNKKVTPFQKEQIEAHRQILEYKLTPEANIVGIIYKNPDMIYSADELSIDDFSNNIWRVYFEIAKDILLVERKETLDQYVVGRYLVKHPKLKEKFEEYGGYQAVVDTGKYVSEENFDAYVEELHKWNAVLTLNKMGFPVKEDLSRYVDMQADEIYDRFEANINNIFANAQHAAKSYNIFDGMNKFIDEADKGESIGLPFYNSPLLTKEVGGFNINGNIYGLGANSGIGKSTMSFNYLLPSVIETNERIVFFINEEDERKYQRELLVWVANNIFKGEGIEGGVKKHMIRDGHFSPELMSLLRKSANWIESKKDDHVLTVVPLERYSVNMVTKLIKKYNSAFGIRMFVLDTLKESSDAKSDDIFKTMMRDMVKLYDLVKPKSRNVGLFVTYQLSKSSIKTRHLTNNDIGQAKSIMDTMSVNLMMRKPFDDEYEGGKNELKWWRIEKSANGSIKKINNTLKRDKKYMITFVTKNRFGETDSKQIVSECDLGTNIYRDIGYANVIQDW